MKTTLTIASLALATAVAVACEKDDDAAAPPTTDAGSGLEAGALVCPVGYAECDGNPATLCESHVDADPANCGGCGKACPAGNAHQRASCASSVCLLVCDTGFVDCDGDPANGCELEESLCGVTVLASYSAPGGIALDDAFVYYGSRGSPPDYLDGVVYRVPKTGGTPSVVATGLNRPLALAVDDDRVYAMNGGHADVADGNVTFIAKDGGATIATIGPFMRPNNPAITGDQLFFTTREQPAGAVHVTRKDGTDPDASVVVPSVVGVNDLELAGDTLVWAAGGQPDGGPDATVERAALDGGARIVLARDIPNPSFQIGVGADALYVGSQVDNTIRRVPLAGGGPPTILASGLGNVQETIVDGTMLYATTGTAKSVVAIPLAGGATIVLASNQVNPSYMAIDADYIYYTDGPLNGAATVRKVKKPPQ